MAKSRRLTEEQFDKLCSMKRLFGVRKSRIYRVCVLGQTAAQVAKDDGICKETVYKQIKDAFTEKREIKLT